MLRSKQENSKAQSKAPELRFRGFADLSLGAYVGIPVKSEQPMSFVDRADKAMYQSKEAGRNRLTVTFG